MATTSPRRAIFCRVLGWILSSAAASSLSSKGSNSPSETTGGRVVFSSTSLWFISDILNGIGDSQTAERFSLRPSANGQSTMKRGYQAFVRTPDRLLSLNVSRQDSCYRAVTACCQCADSLGSFAFQRLCYPQIECSSNGLIM